jgi:hypothetical protein
MSQLTIYLPDEVARRVQGAARRARKSVSAYVASLVDPARKKPDQRRKRLLALYGSWEGTAPALSDPPPGRVRW